MIPKLNDNGKLPPGEHLCTANEFLDVFLFNDYRKALEKSLADIFDWAVNRGAVYLFIGGSFVSSTAEPNDIDCLIIFPDDSSIPHRTELLTILSTKIDIQFCSQQHPELIDNFIYLFEHSRQMHEVGVIQVDLYSTKEKWKVRYHPTDPDYEIVKRAYINRHFVDHHEATGVLVTIHGLSSSGTWNSQIAPVASSQNCIFAPFVFKNSNIKLLFSKRERKKVVENFREWLYDIHQRYNYPVSVIAHSFGTYIIGSYIMGFEEFLPVEINTVILTGSILTSKYDWEKYRGAKIARVFNEIAPNDQWVKYMPIINFIKQDPLFGNSGLVGFDNKSVIVTERKSDIFDHNNVIM